VFSERYPVITIAAAVLTYSFWLPASAMPYCAAQEEHATESAAEGEHGEEAAHDGAHEEGHAHFGAVGANTEPSEFKSDLAIYTVVVFLLLLAILYKFAWGPISSGLDKREHRIAEHIAAAERSHEEAKAMLAQYEAKLAASQEEVRAILEEARRDAEHTQQEILAKARADASAEIERGKREIETATAQALKELAETSANLAVDLAGKVVQAQLNPADHARLITDALSRFPGNVAQN